MQSHNYFSAFRMILSVLDYNLYDLKRNICIIFKFEILNSHTLEFNKT